MEALQLNQEDLTRVIGVENDSNSTSLLKSSLWTLFPELEPSPEYVAKASLVFNDRTLLGQILEAINNSDQQSSKSLLLISFLLRGLLTMIGLS